MQKGEHTRNGEIRRNIEIFLNPITVEAGNIYNHAPEGYTCPFCLLVSGIENEHVRSKQADIIYKDHYITAFIASHWYPNNEGHVLIIPNQHIENIYTLDVEISNRIHELEIEIAKGLKEVYKCDGVSSRQHNEPDGSQDVWHYHLHVFPRYHADNLYGTYGKLSDETARKNFAQLLRRYLSNNKNIGAY
ncbi:HIT family protein [Paenibacillus sp. FSL R10-2791]|uniref:HIT family protein n=1 Tax=Paenibacillus TaxID=44249 RepID=UPI001FD14BFA|nr:HIT family protein [Paenibacillus odorifer]